MTDKEMVIYLLDKTGKEDLTSIDEDGDISLECGFETITFSFDTLGNLTDIINW